MAREGPSASHRWRFEAGDRDVHVQQELRRYRHRLREGVLFYRLACCRIDSDIPCVQVREHVELLKAAQPPIGLVICDEGALLEQHLYPLSRKLTRLVILQDIASSRTRPRRARPCNRCRACVE